MVINNLYKPCSDSRKNHQIAVLSVSNEHLVSFLIYGISLNNKEFFFIKIFRITKLIDLNLYYYVIYFI